MVSVPAFFTVFPGEVFALVAGSDSEVIAVYKSLKTALKCVDVNSLNAKKVRTSSFCENV